MRLSLILWLIVAACSGRGPTSTTRASAAASGLGVPADLTLALSSAREPVARAPMIAVSPREITVEGQSLVQLGATGDLLPAQRTGMLIPAVFDALAIERQQQSERDLLRGDSVDGPHHLNIAIDASTPWATVAAVLYTSGQAQHEQHRFVVTTAAGELRAIRSEFPTLADIDRQIGLTVRVDRASLAVIEASARVADGSSDPESTQERERIPVDAAALTAAARARKQAEPERQAVLLDIAPGATWAQVVSALDATRDDELGALYPSAMFGHGVD